MPKYLGIDIGLSRTGIAISDPLGICAFPRAFISHKDIEGLFSELVKLIELEEITHIVIGNPLNMDGSRSQMSILASDLAQRLSTNLNIGVSLLDERRTTLFASQALHDMGISAKKGKGKKDSVSASIILSTFIERQGIGTDIA